MIIIVILLICKIYKHVDYCLLLYGFYTLICEMIYNISGMYLKIISQYNRNSAYNSMPDIRYNSSIIIIILL
jgi:hypothetical protein